MIHSPRDLSGSDKIKFGMLDHEPPVTPGEPRNVRPPIEVVRKRTVRA